MTRPANKALLGANVPDLGPLREAKWDPRKRQWKMPPLETTRVHGLEVTQTECRFEMVELDTFGYSTDLQHRPAGAGLP
ncbi:hypothetical protein GCM10010493_65510 [Streptomyces lavendulae subsp. grasserius]